MPPIEFDSTVTLSLHPTKSASPLVVLPEFVFMTELLSLDPPQSRKVQPHHPKNHPYKFFPIPNYRPLASRSRIRPMSVLPLDEQIEFVVDVVNSLLSCIILPNNFVHVFL